MDQKYQIQLGEKKNVNAVNVDQNILLNFKTNQKEILSYNESSVIDVADLFYSERQNTEIYRIYGKIDLKISIQKFLYYNFELV